MLIDFFGVTGNTLTKLATVWVSEGEIIDSPDKNDIGETIYDVVTSFENGTEDNDELFEHDPDDDFQVILEKIDELEDEYGDEFAEYGWS
jgi:hypothetical protein